MPAAPPPLLDMSLVTVIYGCRILSTEFILQCYLLIQTDETFKLVRNKIIIANIDRLT